MKKKKNILINNNIGQVFVKNTTSPINITVTNSAKKKKKKHYVKVKISYGTERWDHRWEKNEIV